MNSRRPALQSFAEYRANSYFGALDGLRALSILLVLLHHTQRFSLPLVQQLQENGRYGVSFFFVISGFLICTLFLREEAATGRISLPRFYGRRALRLLPLYYAVLAMECTLVFVLKQYSPDNQLLFRAKLPSYLFYFSNWLPTATQGPFFCSWSLAVEEQFYLVFGYLIVFAARRHLIAALAGALLLKFGVYLLFGNVDTQSIVWRILFSYQEAILWGVLLAFALHTKKGYEVVHRFLRTPWLSTALFAATVAWLTVHPMQSQSSWDAELLFILMTLGVGAVVIRRDVPVLTNAFLMHVGRISYGIYLLHMFVINTVNKAGAGLPLAVRATASIAAVILVASIVYRYFESPIIHYYKRRLSPTAKPQAAPPSVPAIATSPATQA